MFVALKDEKTAYVAYTNVDSLLDMSKKDLLLNENVSVWKISGAKGWYAVCGRFYVEADVLQYTKGLFPKEITYQSLLQHTIPKMRQVLDARGLVKDGCWYNELLVLCKHKIYCIDAYFCLEEVTDYEISSARSDIVRGCLAWTEGMPAKERICEAVHSLEVLRGKVCFPVILYDTATGKKEVWYSYEDALSKAKVRGTVDMDALYKEALEVVLAERAVSMSLLQRKLSIGYSKAGQLMERMEKDNYIEEFNGGSARKVLITQAQFDERFNG